jgi:predicted membrane channel-forming protein YqfA (hemolysin III family)
MTTNKNITHVVGLAIFIVALILSIRVIWQQYGEFQKQMQFSSDEQRKHVK